ncbi:917_t:CDS:2 [Racocetra fulgida]|uniref:917_t:CDS:1 n=1 Tax=Racocetra fulgida TaxID=60492 RepID=A0A9N9F0Q9_9GLOM|nr:917_t:CDS:2 [Racocetra fulgida]
MAETLEMVLDDAQSIATLGTNSDILNVVRKLADTVQPFVPLISTVFVVVSEVMKIYDNAKHNKKICASLLVRVNTAKINVKILQFQLRICDHKAFYRFVEVLKKIKNFMNDVSNLSGWKKYATANSVQETFTKLISEFDKSMSDLHFTITISNEEQRKLDQENLNADFEEMKQFLKTIAGGITDNNSQINTIINELQIINEKVGLLINGSNNVGNQINHLKAIKINPKELDDLPYEEIKLCAGKSIYNCEKFIKYLTKAADAGNAMAQYNLGDMHLKGNLSSLSNSDLGIKYLKLAALNGHSKAVEVLKENDININE